MLDVMGLSLPDTTDTTTAVHDGLRDLERARPQASLVRRVGFAGSRCVRSPGISVVALIVALRTGPGDWTFWVGVGLGVVGALLFVASMVWLLMHRVRPEPDSTSTR